jgi:hypothetical protein
MLDKILGKKDKDKNDTPDLRKNGKKSDSDNSDIGGRLKDMVGKVSGKQKDKAKDKTGFNDKKSSSDKKMPRPISKPKPKQPIEKPRLKPPEKKKPGGFAAGLGGGFGKQLPDDDDQRTLIGAAVFGIILILLVGAGYYFLVFAPYQDTLNGAKMAKINEVNSYFKGALAVDPRKNMILADIDSGVTPDQVLAVDVLGPATSAWREYQTQQINLKKDPYGRVMISYSTPSSTGNDTNSTTGSLTTSASDMKNLIVKVADAQKIVNEADASVLANMDIRTPDTVAVPIMITRLQAAGGLVNVGDAVDVYQNVAPVTATGNNTTNQTTETAVDNSPKISGATVLAILRATDSGSVDATLNKSQSFAINTAGVSTSTAQTSQADVEQLLRAASSRTWNEGQISSLLTAYGWRLSDFERVSNLGQLDAQYLILLEVPRENALWLIQNQNSTVLTVPTQQAPEWMIQELQQIYGAG